MSRHQGAIGYARAGAGFAAEETAIAAACAERGWELVRVEAEEASGGKAEVTAPTYSFSEPVEPARATSRGNAVASDHHSVRFQP